MCVLILSLFFKSAENWPKNRNFYCRGVLEFSFEFVSGLGFSIFLKKSKSSYPDVYTNCLWTPGEMSNLQRDLRSRC